MIKLQLKFLSDGNCCRFTLRGLLFQQMPQVSTIQFRKCVLHSVMWRLRSWPSSRKGLHSFIQQLFVNKVTFPPSLSTTTLFFQSLLNLVSPFILKIVLVLTLKYMVMLILGVYSAPGTALSPEGRGAEWGTHIPAFSLYITTSQFCDPWQVT